MQDNNNELAGQIDPIMDNGGEGEKRSEKRYKDLADNVAKLAREKQELTQQFETEKQELSKKTQDAEFRANFSEISVKYPNAREFEKDIRSKVSTGYSLEDAIVSTLASKGRLGTPSTPAEMRSQVTGGSADISFNEPLKDDPSFGGNAKAMREELLRLERDGTLGETRIPRR